MSERTVSDLWVMLERSPLGAWRDAYYYTILSAARDGYDAACQDGRNVKLIRRTVTETEVR